jgi:hypothetical protein
VPRNRGAKTLISGGCARRFAADPNTMHFMIPEVRLLQSDPPASSIIASEACNPTDDSARNDGRKATGHS